MKVKIEILIIVLLSLSFSTCKRAKENLNIPSITISISESTLELTQGEEYILLATIVSEDAQNKEVTWCSNAQGVVTVDKDGKLTALSIGKAVITATVVGGQNTASCQVFVIEKKVEEEGINITIEYETISPGHFVMGSPLSEKNRDDDENQRNILLRKSFRLSKYEITNKQYAEFLNIKKIGADGRWKDATINATEVLIYEDEWGLKYDLSTKMWKSAPSMEEYPVVSVTWFGAMEFAVSVGGTLPTEAQWEYACRGNYPNKDLDTKPFGTGDGDKLNGTMANFYSKYAYQNPGGEYVTSDNSPQKTQKVGTYSPNNYNLYDMHGNVWEWCRDWYDTRYGNNNLSATDPEGARSGDYKVIKGGSWYFFGRSCRSAFRHKAKPDAANNQIGFRVMRNI